VEPKENEVKHFSAKPLISRIKIIVTWRLFKAYDTGMASSQ
jgi:hypothetical protein